MELTGRTLPPLEELGGDLLLVPVWRRAVSLCLPFLLATAFFVLSAHGWWLSALACSAAISFLTYGSISHDLVHRNLRLPRWLNEGLLTALELLALRSGHAYRVTHLHHHARFPAEDDLEAAAAHLPLWRGLLEGFTLQPQLWLYAQRRPGAHRPWVTGEGIAIAILVLGAIAAWPWTRLPAIYAGLMIAGSWVFPVATVIIPHHARGDDTLTQTRLFRGRFFSLLTCEHFYHLEHHLYPQVPHHNWVKLAHRLDPHFARLGLQPVTLFF